MKLPEFVITTCTLDLLLSQQSDEFVNDVYKQIYDGAVKLLKVPNPLSSVPFFHSKVDEVQKKNPDNGITCKKGCSTCCYIPVMVSTLEANFLFQLVKDKKIEIDLNLLQGQAKETEKTWFKIPFQERKCVFLTEEGSCGIYDQRPLVCRNFAVTSDPKECERADKLVSEGRKDIEVNQSALYENEMYASILITAFPAKETLAQQLYRHLKG